MFPQQVDWNAPPHPIFIPWYMKPRIRLFLNDLNGAFISVNLAYKPNGALISTTWLKRSSFNCARAARESSVRVHQRAREVCRFARDIPIAKLVAKYVIYLNSI